MKKDVVTVRLSPELKAEAAKRNSLCLEYLIGGLRLGFVEPRPEVEDAR